MFNVQSCLIVFCSISFCSCFFSQNLWRKIALTSRRLTMPFVIKHGELENPPFDIVDFLMYCESAFAGDFSPRFIANQTYSNIQSSKTKCWKLVPANLNIKSAKEWGFESRESQPEPAFWVNRNPFFFFQKTFPNRLSTCKVPTMWGPQPEYLILYKPHENSFVHGYHKTRVKLELCGSQISYRLGAPLCRVKRLGLLSCNVHQSGLGDDHGNAEHENQHQSDLNQQRRYEGPSTGLFVGYFPNVYDAEVVHCLNQV